MNIKHIIYIATILLLAACTTDDADQRLVSDGGFTLSTEIVPFEGGGMSRATMAGDEFDLNDWIRIKIICPFSNTTEFGETTNSGSFDSFYLLKYVEIKDKDGNVTGKGWKSLDTDDKCDINGTYSYGNSPDIGSSSYYEAQQTPYVYMASTWSEEKSFRSPDGLVLQFCHVFHADQRDDAAYKASDLLWAQQYMQTGSWNVKLSFKHKMSRLVFNIDDSDLPDSEKIRPEDDAVLSLSGMPDIDQQEIVVGDYYAERSKSNSRYGYQQKASCKYDYNGKVIGIGVNDDTSKRAYAYPMTGNPNPAYNTTYPAEKIIKNEGTYIAHKTGLNTYCMIVPPCLIDSAHKPELWLRNGEHRYVMTLNEIKFEDQTLTELRFEEGKSYNVTMTIKKANE